MGGWSYRLGGLLCLAIASAAGWWGIWQPYQQALAGAAEVQYSLKVFVLAPVALIFGLFFVVFGDSVPYRDAQAQKLTPAGWILMAIVTVVSSASFWWFKQAFETLGFN